MAIHRLNHAVLYVRDAEQSADFYCEILGFRRLPAGIPGAVFLRAEGSSNDHDLGLFSVGENAVPSAAGRGAVGLYHLAWEVDTLADLHDLALKLREAGALVGASDHGSTKALYGRDPDGIDFEIAWLVPADLLGDEQAPKTAPLDLAKEIEKFGAGTLGGIGVSREQPMEVRQ